MISQPALKLILEFEGVDQPWQWPGGDSGITIGYGYDLGYCTAARFAADWKGRLPAPHYDKLAKVIGFKGHAAEVQAPKFRGIVIDTLASRAVLLERTLPEEEAKTRAAFPGVDKLPADAYGALVSLVYNRGASMGTPGHASYADRQEMRDIAHSIALYAAGSLPLHQTLGSIAAYLRAMKRLWEGKKMAGLIKRRFAEAELVERAS
jgi:GH24 family phage-related lysozyme (muramidase)